MTVFEKFFVLAILTRTEIHQMSMNFCIELNGKEPKNIQFKKIEFDAWNVVLYEVELIDIDNRLSKFIN